MANPLERLRQKLKGRFEKEEALAHHERAPLEYHIYERLHKSLVSLTEETPAQAIQELTEIVETVNLAPEVEDVWEFIEPFAHVTQEPKLQQAALKFAQACVLSPSANADLLRLSIYKTLVQSSWGKEHLDLRLRILRDLTKDGRDLREFEESIGDKLWSWLVELDNADEAIRRATPGFNKGPQDQPPHGAKNAQLIHALLEFVTNLVKFSFIAMPETQITRLITTACSMAAQASKNEIVYSVVMLLDAVVRYGSVPLGALRSVTETLAYIVNLSSLTQESWQIMRNLLKSHRSQNTMDYLCRIIGEPGSESSDGRYKIRGAVFYMCMANWGAHRVKHLSYPHIYLLQYLRRAAEHDDEEINVEVLLAVQRLISTHHDKLSTIEWEALLDILSSVSNLWEVKEQQNRSLLLESRGGGESEVSSESLIFRIFSDLLQSLKAIFLEQPGSVYPLFWDILMRLGPFLPEATISLFLEHTSSLSCHEAFSDWIDHMAKIVHTFYLRDLRMSIRLQILHFVKRLYISLGQAEQEAAFEFVISPMIKQLAREMDPSVFQEAILLVTDLSYSCGEKHFTSVIEGLVRCALNTESEAIASVLMLAELLSAMAAHSAVAVNPGTGALTPAMSLQAMVAILHLFETSATMKQGVGCLLIFKYLVRIPTFYAAPHDVRLCCLEYLLNMRADATYRIFLSSLPTPPKSIGNHLEKGGITSGSLLLRALPGPTYVSDNQHLISSSLSCFTQGRMGPSVSSPTAKLPVQPSVQVEDDMLCVMPIAQHTAALLLILTREKNWEVYWKVMQHLATQLLNVEFFEAAGPQLTVLRAFFCDMITHERAAATIQDLPGTVRKSDIYLVALKILTTLLAYRQFFTKQDQDEMLLAFQTGLHRWPGAAKNCIHAFTLTLLEMPESMTKLLPGTLLKVSQMMSTAMAVHNLEFLATLARLPTLRINFTDTDVKRVFVIALQYINTVNTASQVASASSALSYYVVQLAYRVLLAWFVTLRLSERKKYVPFIIHYLLLGNDRQTATLDENIELVLDMLIHHSFADCWPKPKEGLVKADKQERLPSRSWVQGNSLLTVKISNQPGWANVIIRRPSGVISFSVRLENSLKSTVAPIVPLLAPIALEKADRDHRLSNSKKALGEVTGATLRRSDSDGSSFHHARRHLRSASLASISEFHAPGEYMASLEASRVKSETALGTPPKDYPAGDYFSDESAGALRRARSTSMSSAILPEGLDLMISMPSPHHEYPGENKPSKSPPTRLPKPSASVTARGYEGQQLIDPSFILAQFIAYPNLRSQETLLLLPDDEGTKRALSVLDRTPIVDLHKIGVIYVGPNQRSEAEILSNSHGSRMYGCFLQSLGRITRLKGCRDVYTGGLDTAEDLDGRYAIYAQDELAQTIFHVTTLMPTLEHDPRGTSKKRHIGNDFVRIVWNESGENYDFDAIPSQFNFVNIIIERAGNHRQGETTCDEKGGKSMETADRRGLADYRKQFFKVFAKSRQDMPEIGPLSEPKLVSGASLSTFVRQAAVHANIFSQIFQQSGNTHTSNARERLRQIKRMKTRAETANTVAVEGINTVGDNWENLFDFTRFT